RRDEHAVIVKRVEQGIGYFPTVRLAAHYSECRDDDFVLAGRNERNLAGIQPRTQPEVVEQDLRWAALRNNLSSVAHHADAADHARGFAHVITERRTGDSIFSCII